MSTEKMKVADFVSTEDLISSCNLACNMYKVYLMDKKKED